MPLHCASGDSGALRNAFLAWKCWIGNVVAVLQHRLERRHCRPCHGVIGTDVAQVSPSTVGVLAESLVLAFSRSSLWAIRRDGAECRPVLKGGNRHRGAPKVANRRFRNWRRRSGRVLPSPGQNGHPTLTRFGLESSPSKKWTTRCLPKV